jgi:hypothetical protein
VFSGRNPTLVIDCTSYSLEELSVAGFTPEVVENFGAEYFDVELQKKWDKESAVRAEYEKKRVKESSAAGAAASADKKKRKPQFSPAGDPSSAEEMDVSPTGGLAMVPPPTVTPLNLEGVLSPEVLRTDMELEVLHQKTVEKNAQIFDSIFSETFHIFDLFWCNIWD